MRSSSHCQSNTATQSAHHQSSPSAVGRRQHRHQRESLERHDASWKPVGEPGRAGPHEGRGKGQVTTCIGLEPARELPRVYTTTLQTLLNRCKPCWRVGSAPTTTPTKKDNPTMKSVLKLQRHLQVQRQPCPGGTYSSSQGQVACNTCPQGEAVCILLLLCSLLLL